ncbi:MAG: hypothetical protein ACT4PI_04725 [Actinomycetota bacterium]
MPEIARYAPGGSPLAKVPRGQYSPRTGQSRRGCPGSEATGCRCAEDSSWSPPWPGSRSYRPPIGTGTCPGVRPGAIVRSDAGQCTFNFLFQGSDGRRYIGTAGHCILGESPVGGDVGEQSWAPGTGPEARDANNQRVGEFAYAILQDPKDFALIRLDPGVAANPQMCHFGGPTGVNADMPSSLVTLQHFGNGVGGGAVLPARTAFAIGMPDPDHVFAQGAAVPGDSGSGIISDDGRAVGVIVTVGVHSSSIGTGGVDAGIVGITRLSPQVARAQQVLGLALTLQTAAQL